jgi:hypothetical protein
MSIVRRFGPIPVAGLKNTVRCSKVSPLADNPRTATIARVATKRANGRAICDDEWQSSFFDVDFPQK